MPADSELEKCITELADLIERLDARGLKLAAHLAGAASLAIKMHIHEITAEELELVEFLAELELHGQAPDDAQSEQDKDPD